MSTMHSKWMLIVFLVDVLIRCYSQNVEKPHFEIDHEAGKLNIEASKTAADITYGADQVDVVLKPGQEEISARKKSDCSQAPSSGCDIAHNNAQSSSSNKQILSREDKSAVSLYLDVSTHNNATVEEEDSQKENLKPKKSNLFLKALGDIKALVQEAMKKEETNSEDGNTSKEMDVSRVSGKTGNGVASKAKELLQRLKEGGQSKEDLSAYVVKAKQILASLKKTKAKTSSDVAQELSASNAGKVIPEQSGPELHPSNSMTYISPDNRNSDHENTSVTQQDDSKLVSFPSNDSQTSSTSSSKGSKADTSERSVAKQPSPPNSNSVVENTHTDDSTSAMTKQHDTKISTNETSKGNENIGSKSVPPARNSSLPDTGSLSSRLSNSSDIVNTKLGDQQKSFKTDEELGVEESSPKSIDQQPSMNQENSTKSTEDVYATIDNNLTVNMTNEEISNTSTSNITKNGGPKMNTGKSEGKHESNTHADKPREQTTAPKLATAPGSNEADKEHSRHRVVLVRKPAMIRPALKYSSYEKPRKNEKKEEKHNNMKVQSKAFTTTPQNPVKDKFMYHRSKHFKDHKKAFPVTRNKTVLKDEQYVESPHEKVKHYHHSHHEDDGENYEDDMRNADGNEEYEGAANDDDKHFHKAHSSSHHSHARHSHQHHESPDDEESLSDDTEPSNEDHESSNDAREQSNEDHASSNDAREQSNEDQELSDDDKESSYEDQESSSYDKESSNDEEEANRDRHDNREFKEHKPKPTTHESTPPRIPYHKILKNRKKNEHNDWDVNRNQNKSYYDNVDDEQYAPAEATPHGVAMVKPTWRSTSTKHKYSKSMPHHGHRKHEQEHPPVDNPLIPRPYTRHVSTENMTDNAVATIQALEKAKSVAADVLADLNYAKKLKNESMSSIFPSTEHSILSPPGTFSDKQLDSKTHTSVSHKAPENAHSTSAVNSITSPQQVAVAVEPPGSRVGTPNPYIPSGFSKNDELSEISLQGPDNSKQTRISEKNRKMVPVEKVRPAAGHQASKTAKKVKSTSKLTTPSPKKALHQKAKATETHHAKTESNVISASELPKLKVHDQPVGKTSSPSKPKEPSKGSGMEVKSPSATTQTSEKSASKSGGESRIKATFTPSDHGANLMDVTETVSNTNQTKLSYNYDNFTDMVTVEATDGVSPSHHNSSRHMRNTTSATTPNTVVVNFSIKENEDNKDTDTDKTSHTSSAQHNSDPIEVSATVPENLRKATSDTDDRSGDHAVLVSTTATSNGNTSVGSSPTDAGNSTLNGTQHVQLEDSGSLPNQTQGSGLKNNSFRSSADESVNDSGAVVEHQIDNSTTASNASSLAHSANNTLTHAEPDHANETTSSANATKPMELHNISSTMESEKLIAATEHNETADTDSEAVPFSVKILDADQGLENKTSVENVPNHGHKYQVFSSSDEDTRQAEEMLSVLKDLSESETDTAKNTVAVADAGRISPSVTATNKENYGITENNLMKTFTSSIKDDCHDSLVKNSCAGVVDVSEEKGADNNAVSISNAPVNASKEDISIRIESQTKEEAPSTHDKIAPRNSSLSGSNESQHLVANTTSVNRGKSFAAGNQTQLLAAHSNNTTSRKVTNNTKQSADFSSGVKTSDKIASSEKISDNVQKTLAGGAALTQEVAKSMEELEALVNAYQQKHAPVEEKPKPNSARFMTNHDPDPVSSRFVPVETVTADSHNRSLSDSEIDEQAAAAMENLQELMESSDSLLQSQRFDSKNAPEAVRTPVSRSSSPNVHNSTVTPDSKQYALSSDPGSHFTNASEWNPREGENNADRKTKLGKYDDAVKLSNSTNSPSNSTRRVIAGEAIKNEDSSKRDMFKQFQNKSDELNRVSDHFDGLQLNNAVNNLHNNGAEVASKLIEAHKMRDFKSIAKEKDMEASNKVHAEEMKLKEQEDNTWHQEKDTADITSPYYKVSARNSSVSPQQDIAALFIQPHKSKNLQSEQNSALKSKPSDNAHQNVTNEDEALTTLQDEGPDVDYVQEFSSPADDFSTQPPTNSSKPAAHNLTLKAEESNIKSVPDVGNSDASLKTPILPAGTPETVSEKQTNDPDIHSSINENFLAATNAIIDNTLVKKLEEMEKVEESYIKKKNETYDPYANFKRSFLPP